MKHQSHPYFYPQPHVSENCTVGVYSQRRKTHHTAIVTRTPTGSWMDVWPTSGSWQCCPLNPAGQEHT